MKHCEVSFMILTYCLKEKDVKKQARKSRTKKAIQIYWLRQDPYGHYLENGVQAESLGPLTLWVFVFLPLY